jgi:putative ABC transport system permease protein
MSTPSGLCWRAIMRDWPSYVRSRLPLKGVTPAREARLVSEVATQLEDLYRDALLGGASEDEADAIARRHVQDWSKLAADLSGADGAGRISPVESWLDEGEAARVAASGDGRWAASFRAVLGGIRMDLRYGLRLLWRNPTFALVAVITLALGTGANAAIFQLVNALLLRPLPVERPDQLFAIDVDTGGRSQVGMRMTQRATLSEPLWRAIDARQQGFSSVFVYGATRWNVATDGSVRRAEGLYVSGDFFRGLGVRAQVGRLLTAADDRAGCASPGAVLSDGFWRASYGGDPAVVGKPISLDGRILDIVGVTPPGFFGAEAGRTYDVAIPLCAEPMIRGTSSGFSRSDWWFLNGMGRIKPDWTHERASAQLAAISAGVFASTVPPSYTVEYARDYRAFRLTARPGGTGASGLPPVYTRQLWVLLGVTALVLLLACVNLANLMVARATYRDREMAIRLAVGASRRRLVGQLLSESFLIAALGAGLGFVISRWFSQALVAFLNTRSNRIFLTLAPDWRVLVFLFLVAGAACLVFGVGPALAATAGNPGRSLPSGGRLQSDSRRRLTLRRALIVGQVALSMALVVCALLFGRNLLGLAKNDPGFRTDGIVTLTVDLQASGIAPSARALAAEEIRSRLEATPGVSAVAETFILPMSGFRWNERVEAGAGVDGQMSWFHEVTGEYFKVMDIPVVAGHTFDKGDRLGAPRVAIVNKAFARRFFPSVSPVGQYFQTEASPGAPPPRYAVVGLVADSKYADVRELEPVPIVYVAATQDPDRMPALNFVVRSDLSPASLTHVVTSAAPGATVAFDSVARFIRDSLTTERLMASLSEFFGALAMLIAAVGLYGLMSYSVMRRRIEFGIRMALGAHPRQVLGLVLRESSLLVVLGIAGGAALALAATRWTATLLAGLSARDPWSFGLAAGALGAVSAAAAWVPARRAARVDAAVALRSD